MTFLKANQGDIVYSKAGRDKEGYFIVISVDGEYVQICDGKRRKVDRPKRKKLKHLKFGVGYSNFIAKKLAGNEKITNLEVRRELSGFNNVEPANEKGCK